MARSNYISNEEAKLRFYQFQKDGKQESLANLYKPFMKMVFSVGLKYFQDTNKADDLVMDVYEILNKKARSHQVSHISSWIYSIAKNECLMQLRKKKVEIASEHVNFNEQAMENEEFLHLMNEQKEEKMHALHYCLNQLKTEQKQCIIFFYLQKKSYKQIAEEGNLEVKKVKSFIQNGKRNLKNCIESKL